MLVDVVEMRRAGQRLPREAIELLPRTRGLLTIGTRTSRLPAADPRAELIAILYAMGGQDEHAWALEALRHARVATVRNGAMLVVGEQRLYRPEPRHYNVYRQAWWVLPVGQHRDALARPAA